MSRLPLVPDDADDPDLAAVFDLFRDRDRAVPELYRTLGNSPKLLRAWTRFAWPLRNDSTTSRALRELIIMRVAQLTEAETEWMAHWDMALEAGNTPEKLAALAGWESSDAFTDEERVVLAFTDEMTGDVEVSATTYAAVEERFGPGEIVELTLTAAFYSCVSRVLRTLDVAPPTRSTPALDAMRGTPPG